ncbi:MAG: hypothetical protein KKF78_08565, partial [Candidatus Omnitrophica bacterium]|nr:hypothetical protein [Candidatus Omnitrophota bacterium]
LSRLYYYVLHCFVGSNFMIFNILNFLMYFLSMLLIYRFILYFVEDRVMSAAFIGTCAFLFTHFDILLWSCHTYIIFGLISFLFGFINYVKFVKTKNTSFLFFVGALFLIGMWSYEAFALWPLAIIFLSSIKNFKNDSTKKKFWHAKINFIFLGMIYALYFGAYLFTRAINTYSAPTYKISSFFNLSSFVYASLKVLFNFLYNTVFVNVLPFLAFPLNVSENIYMRGPILEFINNENGWIIFIIGTFVGIMLTVLFIWLKNKKYYEEMKIVGFLAFLMLSEPFVIFFFREASNPSIYSLTEFRYQYVPNIVFALVLIYAICKIMRSSKTMRKAIFALLAFVFIGNIYFSNKVISIYNSDLSNLKKVFSSVRTGIKDGLINNENNLYIDKNIHEYLPSLCWNVYMGERFIKEGNYKWLFSKKELAYFTEDINAAKWIIDKDTFYVVEKTFENLKKEGKFISKGKGEQYRELGYYYMDNSDFHNAVIMLEKSFIEDPGNEDARKALGESQQKF